MIIPAFGREDLTTALLEDVNQEPEIVRVFVVDNGGAHVAVHNENVLRPGENLGWLRGCNLGLAAARSHGGHTGYVLLNNDTRLSRNFFAGLQEALHRSRSDLISPVYDDWWWHLQAPVGAKAEEYAATPRDRRVPFVDGTCMLISASAYERLGGLDERFATYGWGGEIDYSLRVRRAGGRVVVTERSFLEHRGGATAQDVYGSAYGSAADAAMSTALAEKWGTRWRAAAGLHPTHNQSAPRWRAHQRLRQELALRSLHDPPR